MLYALINEDGQIVRTEDREHEPVGVRLLSNNAPALRPIVFDNDGLTPWQEYGNPVDTVYNDHVLRRLPAVDKDLATLKRSKQDMVDSIMLQKWDDGVQLENGQILQLRLPEDQSNITAMATQAMLAKAGGIEWPSNFRWRMKDNSFLTVPTADAMLELAAFAASKVLAARSNAWQHKDAIDALTTAQAVHQYDITTGWSV